MRNLRNWQNGDPSGFFPFRSDLSRASTPPAVSLPGRGDRALWVLRYHTIPLLFLSLANEGPFLRTKPLSIDGKEQGTHLTRFSRGKSFSRRGGFRCAFAEEGGAPAADVFFFVHWHTGKQPADRERFLRKWSVSDLHEISLFRLNSLVEKISAESRAERSTWSIVDFRRREDW